MVIAMIGQKGLPARSGGVERHVETLAAGLASRGHRVVVFGRAWYVGTPPLARGGVEQILTPGIRTKHLDAITHSFTALWKARSFKPDVVHLHGTGIALLAPMARVLFWRSAVIVTFHSMDRVLLKWGRFARFCFRIGEWMACHVPHRTIAVSQALAAYCQETYGAQTVYVTHPIPMPEMPEEADFERYLEPQGLNKDGYFLFTGRLIPDKMAHLLVDAYGKARAQRPALFADKPLVLVGGAAWTDRYARWLCDLSGKTEGTIMLGEKNGKEMAALQAGAFAHVFPTASEGLSLAMVEACQYGRLVVATDIPANAEATGGNYLRLRPQSVQSIVHGLIQAAEMSYEDRAAIAERARRSVEAAHRLDDRIDEMERVYREARGLPREMTSPSFI